MKVTPSQLKQLIREALKSQLSEISPVSEFNPQKTTPGTDWGGNTPSSDQDYLGKGGRKSPPGVTPGVKKGVTGITSAYSALQRGEDFSIAIPKTMAQALSTWLTRMKGCVSINEAQEVIQEDVTPAHLIAGVGIGILALCVMAMIMGYNAEVDVGGEVAGQEGHAKVVLHGPKKPTA